MSVITATLVKELRKRTGIGMMECKKALIDANGDLKLAIDNIRKSGQAKAVKKAVRIAAEGIIMAAVSADSKFGVLLELNCETDFVVKDANFVAFGNEVLEYILTHKISDINKLKTKFEEQRIAIIAKIGENCNIRRIKILEGEKIGCYLHGIRIGVLVSAESADDKFIKHIAMHIAASKPKYITPDDVPVNIINNEHQIQLDIAMQSGKSYEIVKKIVAGRMNKFTAEISLTGQQFIMDLTKTVGDLLKEKNVKIIDFIRFEVGEGIEKRENDFAAEVAAISK